MPSNAKSLDDIKDRFYRLFNQAADSFDISSHPDTRQTLVTRMQDLTKSIQSIERDAVTIDILKAVKEQGGSIAFETGPDGSTKISVLNPIRLKGSANAP